MIGGHESKTPGPRELRNWTPHRVVLRAAQALDERAERIYECPVDERTARRMAIVTPGVMTGLIVRGVFVALGY